MSACRCCWRHPHSAAGHRCELPAACAGGTPCLRGQAGLGAASWTLAAHLGQAQSATWQAASCWGSAAPATGGPSTGCVWSGSRAQRSRCSPLWRPRFAGSRCRWEVPRLAAAASSGPPAGATGMRRASGCAAGRMQVHPRAESDEPAGWPAPPARRRGR